MKKHRSDKGGTHAKAKNGDPRIGNKYYLMREFFGKKKTFQTQEEMRELFIQYVEKCDGIPIKRYEAIKSGINAGKTYGVDIKRAITWEGFANFIGVSSRTLRNYRNVEEYKDYHEIMSFIEDYIGDEKVVYGLSGVFDSRLAASYIGLANKEEMKIVPVLNFDKEDENA